MKYIDAEELLKHIQDMEEKQYEQETIIESIKAHLTVATLIP